MKCYVKKKGMNLNFSSFFVKRGMRIQYNKKNKEAIKKKVIKKMFKGIEIKNIL